MGSDNISVGLLDTLKMKRVRTIFTHTYPYPHEHSRHAIIAVVVGCLFFISSDNMHTLIDKLDQNIKWWSIYSCLLGFFYFFSSPFIGKTIKPSYSNFSRWYIAWILVAAVYHLPSFQSMGVDIRMNLSMFITIYISSILFLTVFHILFIGLWYVGLVSRVAGKRPEILAIFQNCAVISIACCVFYSHCGNHGVLKDKTLQQRTSHWFPFWFPFWKKEERNTWLAKFLRVNELKDQVCSSWFAPVGSASDYPLLSKWVIYSELACNGSCAGPSDGISPIYSLWATFIGLYIANYVVERSTGWALSHPLSVKEYEKLKRKQMKPDFLDMVPWYSGTSADLFKTVFDLLVSVTVFVGRFDMRMMQAAMRKLEDGAQQDGLLYDHYSERDDLWFDFMADTGDGGNSSYSVARLLAQPSIRIVEDDSVFNLPRGDMLLIGGDLAYPNPSAFTYERRFFCPFEYALQPPPWYKADHIAVKKPELPHGMSELKQYDGPQCYVIPGNHDWFDGLHTYMRYICHKSWLGGWFMPQKKSYFALKLPKRWWVFGLDLALHGDIDVYQFKFFSELVQEKMGADDSVIIMTHEPNWLLDCYWKDVSGKNVSHLICDYLKGRCKLRIAGDLHHYMRHSAVKSDESVNVHHLLVNGCGGAFLHPTHVFRNFRKFCGSTYECKAAYPSFEDSGRIALGNILKFRKKNWQFDFIGGIIYFILVFSMFPQCKLDHILQEDSFSGLLKSFFGTVWNAFLYMLGESCVSLAGAIVLLIVAVTFIPSKASKKKRVIIGLLHVSAHLAAALFLMLLLELGLETCVRHELLATSGYHTLYEWYRTKEGEHFPGGLSSAAASAIYTITEPKILLLPSPVIRSLQEVSSDTEGERERDVIADPPFVLAFKFVRIRYRNLGDWEDWKKLFFIGFAMENGAVSSETQQGASYTYWVREARQDAAPLPVPRKLSADDILASQASQPPTLGSVWNRAGTWEEKNLNKWASDRMKELLMSVASLEFSSGKAEIADVSKCVGDAFLVTVRNKKRVGYTYEFTLKIKGEWTIRQEKKMVKGHIDVPEFSFGELDDLQMDVRLSEEKDLLAEDKLQICQDLKRFLQPVREKLVQFEQELKER